MTAPAMVGAIGHGRTSVLAALLHHEATSIAAPSVRDLAAATGLHFTTAYGHLCRLRAMGLVAWESGREGTLRSTVAIVITKEVA